ncbi:MAG: ABC-type dipeptide/oligopeptide/nickel transport system, ATPase component [Pseudarthrobacter sp.]|nr:ABC-type dipeptide/oligopeptide/nickel transport system, ATPase component [Pseudarthrobacter sp.]
MTGTLSADGISFQYPSRSLRSSQPADPLRNVTLRLTPGAGTALVGGSGSGKSTLVRIMLGLAKPSNGTVALGGRAVRPGPVRSLRWYRREVQYVPQNPAGSLDPRMTVSQLLLEPLRQLRVEGNHRDLVRQALERVELPARVMNQRPDELSGGQNQRVAIARALAVQPAYLLADEPVSGLDLPLRDAVLTLLDRLVHEGLGLLLVTHDLATAARMCGNTAVLCNGGIAEQGPTDHVLAHPSSPAAHALVQAAAAMNLPTAVPAAAL